MTLQRLLYPPMYLGTGIEIAGAYFSPILFLLGITVAATAIILFIVGKAVED